MCTRVYTGIHRYARVCTDIHRHTQIYIDIRRMHRYAQDIYTDTHRYTQMYTDTDRCRPASDDDQDRDQTRRAVKSNKRKMSGARRATPLSIAAIADRRRSVRHVPCITPAPRGRARSDRADQHAPLIGRKTPDRHPSANQRRRWSSPLYRERGRGGM